MSDDLLDDAVAHTRAKHQILQEYLKGWIPILARAQTNRLLYFDGFAGCGELTGGHPGSPLVAIRTAIRAAPTLSPHLEVRLVERDPERCAHLCTTVQRELKEIGSLCDRIHVDHPSCSECEGAVTELLDKHAQSRKQLGPALFFLDQYGYSGFSMDLLRRVLSHEKCETFSYLNWQRMHPYLSDPTKAATFSRALGGDEWREVLKLQKHEKVKRFKTIYINALHERAGAKYVYDFAMRGPDHRLIYWLFFCTNNLKGLEVMKKAMWKVDPTGRFEFSDRDEKQGMLISYTQESLADDLDRELHGRELTSEALKEHVLTKTPEYRFDGAVGILKRRDRLKEQRRQKQTCYIFCSPPMRTRPLFEL